MRLLHPLLIACVAVMGASAACATKPTQPAPGADDQITVVTFNLWHDKGDWPKRQAQIVAGLRELQPDLIALQEVLGHETLPNQAQTLADALGYRMVFSSVDPPDKPRRYGNALLTRHPILAQHWIKLEPLDDSRTALHLRIGFGGRALNVYNTHLHHTEEGSAIRERQVGGLLDFIAVTADGAPSLVLGDFNADAAAPELTAMRRDFGEAYGTLHPHVAPDAKAHSTLNLAYFPPRHIDQVFAQRDAFTPLQSRIILNRADATGVWPSDHFGVFARLRLAPVTTPATGKSAAIRSPSR